ncbi:hypothetical protein [Sphingopyxis flava]|uniref:Uncharacterized protein n=1 Tax=Sphingopyxis flava TaxID=1507287 RepID=A0A1T5CL87_9SPHN|nr:hypothetical protein [Sphingopyxis flava]SKB60207.1 hypothetical protein SAMN06295937_1010162 [Sphingopyxis flava]
MKIWAGLTFALVLPAAVSAGAPRDEAPPGFQVPEIREVPIAAVYNPYWYNYRADIAEAEKELRSDLRRARDREDRRDAWEEWRTEILDADKDYVKAMRKKGYRAARVILG